MVLVRFQACLKTLSCFAAAAMMVALPVFTAAQPLTPGAAAVGGTTGSGELIAPGGGRTSTTTTTRTPRPSGGGRSSGRRLHYPSSNWILSNPPARTQVRGTSIASFEGDANDLGTSTESLTTPQAPADAAALAGSDEGLSPVFTPGVSDQTPTASPADASATAALGPLDEGSGAATTPDSTEAGVSGATVPASATPQAPLDQTADQTTNGASAVASTSPGVTPGIAGAAGAAQGATGSALTAPTDTAASGSAAASDLASAGSATPDTTAVTAGATDATAPGQGAADSLASVTEVADFDMANLPFDISETELTQDHIFRLEPVVALMRAQPLTPLNVVAVISQADGDSEDVKLLARKRILAVRRHILSQGVSSDRLTFKITATAETEDLANHVLIQR